MRRRFFAIFYIVTATLSVRPPRLSWEKFGDLTFFHSSLLNSLTFSDADSAVIARFPMVTIEKWQGCNSTPGCYGNPNPPQSCPTQQDGTLAAAKKLKALNSSIWIASWLDSLRIYEAIHALNPDYKDTMYQACVRPELSGFLDTHPAYLLPNTSGLPALESYIHAHVFDHRAPEVRALWRDVCLNLTATGLIDGCGADASQQPYAFITDVDPIVGTDWEAGRNWTLGNTTKALAPSGGYVLGKLAFELGAYTNGVLQEGCIGGNATINVLKEVAAASLRDGVTYVYECHSNGSMDDFAAFLIGAYPGAFWGFGPWVSKESRIGEQVWLPIFDKSLGVPSTDGTFDLSTSTWSRTFEHASVTFDIKANTGKINFH